MILDSAGCMCKQCSILQMTDEKNGSRISQDLLSIQIDVYRVQERGGDMVVLAWLVAHSLMLAPLCKVQLFWEGHKNVLKRPYGFEIYLVNVKTMRIIAQIFVAFSEKLNFIWQKNWFTK